MIHLTLTTGHRRHSAREEVDDRAIVVLEPLLRDGVHVLPGPSGYRLRVTIDGSALLATALRDDERAPNGVPLASVAVAPDEAALAVVRRLYPAAVLDELTAPACVATIHPTIAIDPAAASWLGDWERCLAWAWVEHRRGAS